MPELPEVEVARLQLVGWCAGRTLRALTLPDLRVLKRDVQGPSPQQLVGATMGPAQRRGKHLLLPTSAGELLFHFRMTGKLVRSGPGEEETRKVRAVLTLDDGAALNFVDSRCLGELRLFSPGQARPWLDARGLGDEPYPDLRTGAWWGKRLGQLRVALKPALMRQDRVAGLGNIAASEICWRAQLDPTARANTLRQPDWDRVAVCTHRFLHDTIAAETGSEIHYLNDGRGAHNPFSVYLRAGSPCSRCGGPIERFTQSGRGTWWCADCQRRSG